MNIKYHPSKALSRLKKNEGKISRGIPIKQHIIIPRYIKIL